MKEAWAGQVHLLTPPVKSGNTRCWVNVVALVEDPAEFAATIGDVLERRHWSVLEIRRCQPATQCEKPIAELVKQIETVRSGTDTVSFGTMHYYPSRVM